LANLFPFGGHPHQLPSEPSEVSRLRILADLMQHYEKKCCISSTSKPPAYKDSIRECSITQPQKHKMLHIHLWGGKRAHGPPWLARVLFKSLLARPYQTCAWWCRLFTFFLSRGTGVGKSRARLCLNGEPHGKKGMNPNRILSV
jgi:hypothetical protein